MADHPIVHFEIPATDTKATGKFYGDVFDWKIETSPEFDYVMFQSEGGPGGGFVGISAPAHVEYKLDRLLVYLGTEDIEATLATIEAHGGKTVLAKTEIPGIGWWAVFIDPNGNHLGLFTSAPRS